MSHGCISRHLGPICNSAAISGLMTSSFGSHLGHIARTGSVICSKCSKFIALQKRISVPWLYFAPFRPYLQFRGYFGTDDIIFWVPFGPHCSYQVVMSTWKHILVLCLKKPFPKFHSLGSFFSFLQKSHFWLFQSLFGRFLEQKHHNFGPIWATLDVQDW